VTTDSSTGNFNVIIWEKPAVVSNIDSFFIYREITLNNFQKIGAVHRDSLSTFDDYSANPNSTNFKYKIKVLDSCGTVGDFGLYHNSIHLQYLGSGQFQWTFYEIESTANQVSSYNFYRSNDIGFPFLPLQVIPGGNNSYTDVNYTTYPNARYRVDVNWLSGHVCTPTRGTIVTTRSNIKSSSAPIGIKENSAGQLLISPNPASEVITIQYPAGSKKYQLQIFDALGQLVYNESLSGDVSNKGLLTKQIDVSAFRKGIYIMNIQTESGNTFKQVAVQ